MTPFAIHKNVEIRKATFIQPILTIMSVCTIIYVVNTWIIPSRNDELIEVSSHPDDCTCDECIKRGVYLIFDGFDENGDSVFIATKNAE